jgi:Phosphopantetheine attachment site
MITATIPTMADGLTTIVVISPAGSDRNRITPQQRQRRRQIRCGSPNRLLLAFDGPPSNFFTLGGDSLLATRVISRLVRDCGIDLTFAEFSQAPNPRMLQELLDQLGDSVLP